MIPIDHQAAREEAGELVFFFFSRALGTQISSMQNTLLLHIHSCMQPSSGQDTLQQLNGEEVIYLIQEYLSPLAHCGEGPCCRA